MIEGLGGVPYVIIEKKVSLWSASELVGSRNAKGVECFSWRSIAVLYIMNNFARTSP
jgi:hypothetical protein